MQTSQKPVAYFQQHIPQYMDDLFQLLRIASVSNNAENKEDINQAAQYLDQKLKSLGFTSNIFPTKRHPIIIAELIQNPAYPTVLIYGHYDVQPVDPLALWETAPFDPQIRGDYLFARGASDMKGQIAATIIAIDAILKTSSLKLNIKYLLEGEEEIGSPSLDEFIEKNQALIKADFVLNPDASMTAPDKPTIIYGLRGLAYFELRVYGPNADLHSGSFGGIVNNPANALCKLIAQMHDENGKITLPGFYDSVRPLSTEERSQLAELALDDDFFIQTAGVQKLGGETGFTPIERVGARPTLDVNGICSGFIQEGGKTIIPAYAFAKISCRLVPDQNPNDVYAQLKAFLENNAPDNIRWELIQMSGAPAYIIADNAPGVDQFSKALEKVWGRKPIFKREGGSVPVSTTLKNVLGIDSILTGFGLPDDNIHSPNERLHLPTWQKGIQALIHFFTEF